MWLLIQSELTRFRRLAITLAVVHLLVLRGLAALGDLYLPSLAKLLPGLLLYTLGGLTLGLYQLGTYRRINRWTYLIHRPMSPARIFLSLASAALILLLGIIALPWILVTGFLDLMTSQWVDARHYLMAVYLTGTAFSYYLVGAYVVLSRSRAAILAGALPMFFFTWHAVGLWVFVPQLVVVAWLGYLAYSSFEPDLEVFPTRPVRLGAAALTQQLVFLLIVGGATMVVLQTGLILQMHGLRGFAVHSWDEFFPPGTYEHVDYRQRDPAEVIRHGLAESDGDAARFLMPQLGLAESVYLAPSLERSPIPVRHQLLTADRNLVLRESDPDVVWVFSHDRMLFHGRDPVSGAPVGWLGRKGVLPVEGEGGDADRFEEIPRVLDGQLITSRRVYQFDRRERRLRLRFELPTGERLLSTLEDHGSYSTVISDGALYLLEPTDRQDRLSLLEPSARVAVEGEGGRLAGIAVAELIDGYVASLLYGAFDDPGYARPRQDVVEIGIDGDVVPLASRELAYGFPDPYRYRAWIASPVVQHLYDLLWAAVAPHRGNRIGPSEILSRRVPGMVTMAALGVALLSSGLAFLLAYRRRLTRRAVLGWTLVGLLAGVPGLLSCLFLTPKRDRWAAEPRRLSLVPATGAAG